MNHSTSAATNLMSRLTHLSGIRSCILATADGLLVETFGETDDPGATAAICTYILQSTRRLRQLDGYACPTRLTMEGDTSSVLVERLDEHNVLIVSFEDATNLSYIRWLLDGVKREIAAPASNRQ